MLVELPSPEDREQRQAQRRFVNQILEARAEELFQFVRAELARVGMERALIGGVFLTGGGGAAAGSVRRGRASAAMPGALRPAGGDPGLAGGDERSGVDARRRAWRCTRPS